MMRRLFIISALTLLAVVPISAQTALEQHKMLKMDEGVWDARITLWSDPDAEPTVSNLKETNIMVGELWSLGRLQGKIGDIDYVGWATLGYDPVQKQYVGTWIDSLTPTITHMSGTYDPKSKTLTLLYHTLGQDGQKINRKNIMIYKDQNTRDFTMYVKTGEAWVKSMTILYKRIR